jgi:hypothetical protein
MAMSDLHERRSELPPYPARTAPGPSPDAAHLARIARRYAAALRRPRREARPPGPVVHVARRLVCAGQAVARGIRRIAREHWDVGLFDVAFGSLKAFGVYPALYFAGFAWTIPLLEYAPLNTQLWTGAYLFARDQILSQLGRRRYGHSLRRLDALRDAALGIRPRDVRSIHRFQCGGLRWTVRVRRSRLRTWLRRMRGRSPEANVVSASTLRRMLSDTGFRYRANRFRGNAWLYEEILLAEILDKPGDRAKLLASLTPEEPMGEATDELLALLRETPEATRARVFEQGDALRRALKSRLGAGLSLAARALVHLHAAYRREVERRMSALDALEYRLLAARLEGAGAGHSECTPALRCRRAELRGWVELAERFALRAGRVRADAEARALLERSIAQARSLGLRARCARIASWLDGRLDPRPASSTPALAGCADR